MNTKTRPRLKHYAIAALVYMATCWLCVWLLKYPLLDAPIALRAVVSLLPVVPIGYAVRAVVRQVLAGDELQRRIDLEAIAIASVAVSLGCLTLSLLLVAHVFDFTARQALVWVFPAQWITYGFAKIWAAQRYQC